MRALRFPALGLLLILTASPSFGAEPDTVAAMIEGQAAALMSEDPVPPLPGLVVGVVVGDDVRVTGYGTDGRDGTPDGGTVMRVASLTKVFTGLLVATSVETGELSYDAPVTTCTEGHTGGLCFEGNAPTWLDLLTHRGGLPTVPANFDGEASDYDDTAFDAWLAGWTQTSAPGTAFQYSTAGYAVIGRQLEARSETTYGEQLRARVLEPLGLKSTTFEPGEALAPSHRDGQSVADPDRAEPLDPSGGLASTVDDLLLLVRANLEPDGTALGPAIRRTQVVHADRPSFPPSISAQGWQYFEPLQVYWHAGSAPGFSSFVGFNKSSGVGVVLLTNTSLPMGDPRLAQAAFTMIAGLSAPEPPKKR